MNDKPAFKSGSSIASLLLGAGLILLGILFLIGRFAGALFHFDIGHYTWPFFIVIPGLFLFFAAFTLERQTGSALAVIGGMVTMAGAVLLVQNTFDLYASWAYAWALVAPTSIGLAQVVYGGLRGMQDQVKIGIRVAGIGLAIFVAGAFFFELILGISGFRFAGAWMCFPALLIGLGIVLLLYNFLPRRNPPSTQ